MNKTITGHKGGSKKPRQPVEMPDSVRSIARAKIPVCWKNVSSMW